MIVPVSADQKPAGVHPHLSTPAAIKEEPKENTTLKILQPEISARVPRKKGAYHFPLSRPL